MQGQPEQITSSPHLNPRCGLYHHLQYLIPWPCTRPTIPTDAGQRVAQTIEFEFTRLIAVDNPDFIRQPVASPHGNEDIAAVANATEDPGYLCGTENNGICFRYLALNPKFSSSIRTIQIRYAGLCAP